MNRPNLWLPVIGILLTAFFLGGYAAPPPAATPTPSAAVQITGRRLIDDQTDLMYARGMMTGVEKTLVLAQTDEHLLATYDLVGELALDSAHNRLYIDQGPVGLAVINTQTRHLDNLISLPAGFPPTLQADPISGYIMAVRHNIVYIIDPERGATVSTLTSSFTQYIDCASGPVLTAPAIAGISYDPAQRVLYLASATSVCNASASGGSGYSIEAYRLDTGAKIAPGDREWAWFWAQNWSGEAGPIEFDPQRHRYYQVAAGSLRVFDAETMALTLLLPQPILGNFEHYNPTTDQLQFRINGQLVVLPASAIQPPMPAAPKLQSLPQAPVTLLAVSPHWAEDQTLFGLWVDPAQQAECQSGYLNWGEGLLFLSSNGGQTWNQARGGLAGNCELMTTLAVSPDYARDQTLLAGVVGLGIFRSSDGGQLWLPSSVGLTAMNVYQIILSPGFATDQTAFAQAGFEWYRSGNGGRTWQVVDRPLPAQSNYFEILALSPEFATDGLLISAVRNKDLNRTNLYQSHNGGDLWELTGVLPEGVFGQTLSVAPLFAQQQTLFVYGSNRDDTNTNALYHSSDGGQSWKIVLVPELSPGPYATAKVTPSLVYAPGSEANRPIFLLVSETIYQSKDGGQAWQGIELAEGVKPTALAISPNFTQDRTLFIGVTSGQVLKVEVTE